MNIDEKTTALELFASLVSYMAKKETDSVIVTVPTAAGGVKFEVVLVTTEEDLDFSKVPGGEAA